MLMTRYDLELLTGCLFTFLNITVGLGHMCTNAIKYQKMYHFSGLAIVSYDSDDDDNGVIQVGKSTCKPIVVYNQHSVPNVVASIRKDCIHHRFVGFDCEWMPQWVRGQQRNKVALLQISTPKSGTVYLFHLTSWRCVPPALKAFLEDNTIVKVGAYPHFDKAYLEQDYGVDVTSTVDLCCLYKRRDGLQALARDVLGVHISKDDRLNFNWNQIPLTWSSVSYAAKDAFVSGEIFKRWINLKNENGPPFWRHIKPLIEDYYDATLEEVRRRKRGFCCVVCGDEEDLINKHIVPKMYTQHFETDEDDVLPMCKSCNGKSAGYTTRLHNILKFMAGFPLSPRIFNELEEEKNNALRYYRNQSISAKFFRETASWYQKDLSGCRQAFAGEKIVEFFLLNNEPPSKLENLWREVFVEVMNPRFIPQAFSNYHHHEYCL